MLLDAMGITSYRELKGIVEKLIASSNQEKPPSSFDLESVTEAINKQVFTSDSDIISLFNTIYLRDEDQNALFREKLEGCGITLIEELLDSLAAEKLPASIDDDEREYLSRCLAWLERHEGRHPFFVRHSELIGDFSDDGISLVGLVQNILRSELLTTKEKLIVSKRFAINQKKSTLEEIGAELSVTRERIRQLEKKAVGKIWDFLEQFEKNITVDIFRNELERELFGGSTFIDTRGLQAVRSRLSAEIQIYLAASARKIEDAVSRHFPFDSALNGWFLNDDNLDTSSTGDFLDLKERKRLIRKSIILHGFSASLSEITAASQLPEYLIENDVRANKNNFVLGQKLNIKYVSIKKPSFYEKLVMILADRGRAMTLKELAEKYEDRYQQKTSVHNVGATIGRTKEALIVARGKYDLYSNLGLSEGYLADIQNAVSELLIKEQKYLSSKVIYKKLQQDQANLVTKISPYSLHGIIQDCPLFIVRRGLMIGLKRNDFCGKYLSLTEEVIRLFKKEGRPLTAGYIVRAFSESRDLLEPAVSQMMESSEIFKKIPGSGFAINSFDESNIDFEVAIGESLLMEDWDL